jgi:hypothetical protein
MQAIVSTSVAPCADFLASFVTAREPRHGRGEAPHAVWVPIMDEKAATRTDHARAPR